MIKNRDVMKLKSGRRKFSEALLFAFLFVTLASLTLIMFLSFSWVC